MVGIKSGGFNAESKEDRNKSIRCSLKAVDGFLYPLDKVATLSIGTRGTIFLDHRMYAHGAERASDDACGMFAMMHVEYSTAKLVLHG